MSNPTFSEQVLIQAVGSGTGGLVAVVGSLIVVTLDRRHEVKKEHREAARTMLPVVEAIAATFDPIREEMRAQADGAFNTAVHLRRVGEVVTSFQDALVLYRQTYFAVHYRLPKGSQELASAALQAGDKLGHYIDRFSEGKLYNITVFGGELPSVEGVAELCAGAQAKFGSLDKSLRACLLPTGRLSRMVHATRRGRHGRGRTSAGQIH